MTKRLINGFELMQYCVTSSQRFLLEKYLPKRGIAILAGKPDIGKSQFARQLSLAIIDGTEEFLGIKLNAEKKRVIYVSTEDDEYSTAFVLSKQSCFIANPQSKLPNLSFLFSDTMSEKELLECLDKTLEENPSSMVLIDCLGDTNEGDINSPSSVRKMLKEYNKIALKHDCLILFIHHINKNAYEGIAKQQDIQGGSPLVQKVRSALYLKDGHANLRYLINIKNNGASKKHKETAIELEFNEENLLFNTTGNIVQYDEISKVADNSKKYLSLFKEVHDRVTPIPFTYSHLKSKIIEILKISESSAKRYLSTFIELGLITKHGDIYL